MLFAAKVKGKDEVGMELAIRKIPFHRWQILVIATVFLFVTAYFASLVGAANLAAKEIWALRVPRILLAILVGASLASSGTCLQGLFRNPLADPFILGIAAGGALGAATALFLGVPSFAIPFAAFLSALITAWLIYRLGRVNGVVRMDTLLLAGVAMNAFLSSILALLLYMNAHRLLASAVYFWLMGGFQMATWREVWMVFPYALIGLILPLYHARALNALLFGEEWAHYAGVEVEAVKKWLLVAATLSCGAAVSVAGVIGFIGLVAPHFARILVGPHHRTLIPSAAIFGAWLLLCCDMVARTIIKPAEFPVGILTAFLGVPFFLMLLRKSKGVFG